MIDIPLLRNLGLILVFAAGFVLAARLIRMPAIVAYLFAGIALGPVLGLVTVDETLDVISHTGIALLLFLVGLELSIDKVRDIGRVALVAGMGQIAFTTFGGTIVCMLLGFPLGHAFFLALAVTFSSTVVVVKLLDHKRALDRLYGRIAVGIFLVQDIVVILALTVVSGIGAGSGASITGGLARAFGGVLLLIMLAIAAARWVLPALFRWIAESPEGMFIWSLCWCFVFVLLAELLHLSLEIGAFLAGISLAQLPYNHELRRRVHPLMNFFIAVFFVTLGIQLDPGAAVSDPGTAIALSLFVLVASPFLTLWIIARLGYGERTAFLSSVAVAQVSEFSFVLAASALSAGLIDERILSIIGVVGIVTIACSAYMILYDHRLYEVIRGAGLLRLFGARQADDEGRSEQVSGHIVVVGMNALGRRLVRALVERGESVLAIDTDPRKLQGLGVYTMLGSADHVSVLEEAQVHRAKLVITTLQIEDANRLLVWRCREMGVPVAVHAFDQAVVSDLEALGADYLIASKNEGVRVIASRLAEAGLL